MSDDSNLEYYYNGPPPIDECDDEPCDEKDCTCDEAAEPCEEETLQKGCDCDICKAVPMTTPDRRSVIANLALKRFGKTGLSPEEEVTYLCRHVYPGMVGSSAIANWQEVHKILVEVFGEEDQPNEIPEDEREEIDPSQLMSDFNRALHTAKRGCGKKECRLTPELLRDYLGDEMARKFRGPK
jgi:hypothetical protein